MPDEILSQFDKNSTEQIRISQTIFKGLDLIDVRCYYQDDKGELRPTKKGLMLKPQVFAELVAHSLKALDTLGIHVPDLVEEG